MKELKYQITNGDSVTKCPYLDNENIGSFFCLNSCAFFIEIGGDWEEDIFDTIVCEYEDLSK